MIQKNIEKNALLVSSITNFIITLAGFGYIGQLVFKHYS